MGASNFQGLALPKPEPRWKAKAKQAAEKEAVCAECGVSFQKRTNYDTLKAKACSAKCAYILRKKRTRPAKTCSVCGVAFFPGGRFGVTHCSRKCYVKSVAARTMFIEAACAHCSSKFHRTAAALKRVKHSFCSRDCRAKFHTGANSPMFRGDKDPNRGAQWNHLAAQIRRRDGYSCKRCGLCETANGQKLSVDHIRPWRSFTDKAVANEPANLASLCRVCHSFKTTTVEKAWLRGDVIAWKQWVASLNLPSAARFGMMA